MRPLTLQETASALGGRAYGEIATRRVTNVSTDSRRVQDGTLFVAIKGERFDGHDFVEAALERGATAAVVHDAAKMGEAYRNSGRLIEVKDTIVALGKLAGWYRRQFAAQVVAVIGSNGKTTVKDLIASVLGSRLSGRAAPASYNNAIGVPLTLLSVEPSDQFIVVEIGTNYPGEVTSLARIARPDMAVVTSIGEEHLAALGDLNGVAREEFSFLSNMQDRAFAAISDQAGQYAPRYLQNQIKYASTRRRDDQNYSLLIYGFSESADLRAVSVKRTKNGQHFRVNDRFEYSLPLLGRHNILNALAAIAIGTRFRLSHEDIAAALAKVQGPPMRLQRTQLGSMTVINDAYNANPGSMRAAFSAMDDLSGVGRKVFILGDMRELGSQATRCHLAVGEEAGRSTAQVIIAVGAYARIVADGATITAGTSKRIYTCPSIEALVEKLPAWLEPGDAVLLKASRGVQLERIIPAMEESRALRIHHGSRNGGRKVRNQGIG
ncbi:MAG: UDP-N-acetylmuramoyl-tripeptide--D-alanyl-D-alanine ligase [Phycisphaerales bacterium]|nr:UDP-N-acetylmuramoyl-tripeptide--D-alanyl-D-alanine ligase [Phycisphaerales bacterium]